MAEPATDSDTTTPPPASPPEGESKDTEGTAPAPEPGQKPEDGAPEQEPDFEDAELAAAKDEAAKEDTGEGEGEPAPEGEGEAEPPDPAPAAPASKGEPADKGEPAPEPAKATDEKGKVMVPIERLNEAVAKGRETTSQALTDAAYWKGQADARAAAQPPAGAPDEPAGPKQTPEEIIAAANAKKIELAKQYDEGEMSAEEWEEKRTEQENTIHEARATALTPAPAEATPEKAKGDDMYMDQLTSELEAKHPFTTAIPKDDPRWNDIMGLASAELRAEGTVIEPGARGIFQLRERMAELTDVYGPVWTGKTMEQLREERKLPPLDAALESEEGKDEAGQPPKTPPEGEKPKPLSEAAKARAAKLDLAEKQPPDLGDAGSSGAVTEYSEDQIEAMSDDEIAALPESVRRRILPSI